MKTIKQWLLQNLRHWADFQIVPFGTYLGFRVGPLAGGGQWTKALGKFATRAKSIAASRASPVANAFNYNSRALPLLGYKAQLTFLPQETHKIERAAAQQVLHLATNALDEQSLFALHMIGAPEIKNLKAFALAALARTAKNTMLAMWRGWTVQAFAAEKSLQELWRDWPLSARSREKPVSRLQGIGYM